MANLGFSITVPDDKRDEIVEYFVKSHGYIDEIEGAPNPETRNQAARRYIVEYIRNHYKSYKALNEAEAARLAAISAAEGVAIE